MVRCRKTAPATTISAPRDTSPSTPSTHPVASSSTAMGQWQGSEAPSGVREGESAAHMGNERSSGTFRTTSVVLSLSNPRKQHIGVTELREVLHPHGV